MEENMKKKYIYILIVFIIISSVYIYKYTTGEAFIERTLTKIGDKDQKVDSSKIPKDFIETIDELYNIAENNNWSKPDFLALKKDKNTFRALFSSGKYEHGDHGAHLASYSVNLHIKMKRHFFTWKIQDYKINYNSFIEPENN
jgi:hypothetical protein